MKARCASTPAAWLMWMRSVPAVSGSGARSAMSLGFAAQAPATRCAQHQFFRFGQTLTRGGLIKPGGTSPEPRRIFLGGRTLCPICAYRTAVFRKT
eukprot:2600870-Prymnesium_polylepis.1